MSSNFKLKEAFEVESKYGAFYTGGNVELHESHLFCQTSASISKINIETGTISSIIGEELNEDNDTIQTFTSNGVKTVTSHKSGLLKLWNENNEIEKSWKYIHKGPIAKLCLKGDELASGGSDSSVRIWDLEHNACIRNLKGSQGVINVVEYCPFSNVIFASGDDGKICAWEKNEVCNVYNGHFSKVTSLSFHSDEKHFVSSGRDKVIILWEIGNTNSLKIIPVYEGVEFVQILPQKLKILDLSLKKSIFVASAGENGIIRIWDVLKSKEMYAQNNSLVTKAKEEGGLAITKLVFDKEFKVVTVISAEQNIILHELKTFKTLKQLIGFSDEILDITYAGQNDAYLAVATNSNDIKLYQNSSMNCRLLKGHADIVLSLNTAEFDRNLIMSCSKDNNIRLWLLSNDKVECVGVGMGHTGNVTSVDFFHINKLACSVSQDTCLKVWQIPDKPTNNHNLICIGTEVAHNKDINSVAISPNDKIIATASQDKTAKLWSENLTLLGILKGHKRGVWCVRFSPVDQVLLTSSADCSIKLWSIADLNCLKTIEGHESSIIRAEFVSNGMQILSAGADGLIKLFDLKSSENTLTLDEHESRIWSLAIKKDETGFITGGSDSTLIKWKDVTEIKKIEKIKEMEELTAEEQKLSNYLHNDNLLTALKLALKLEKPLKVLRIVEAVIKKGDSRLIDTIQELREDQKEALLRCASDWNTNSRNCHAAQLVLKILIIEVQMGNFRPKDLAPIVEGALPYTERHFKRVTQIMEDLHYITYTINCMQPHATST